MKFISKLSLLITLVTLFFTSCNKNEITNISLNKSTLSINVGITDSIIATVTFAGDMNNESITWISSNPDVAKISESSLTSSKSSSSSSFTKTILFQGLKEGTTLITIKAGEKTVSCNITVGKQNLIFNKTYIANWGDFYHFGTNSFDMLLLDNNLAIDTLTNNIIGNGSYIYLEFNVPITQDGLTTSEFSMSNTGGPNTFFPGEIVEATDGSINTIGSRLVTTSESGIETTLLVGGKYSFVVSGDKFVLVGDFITENNEEIHCTYEGSFNVYDNRESLSPTFTKGRITYYGDAYDTKLSNNFMIELGTDGIVWADSIWYGEVLQLELNTPLTVTDSIPNGKYKMAVEELTPFTLVPGFVSNNNYPWGCWYFGNNFRNYESGEVDVKKVNDIYTIDFNLADINSRTINGTYTGPLSYIDSRVTEISAVSASKVKGIKPTGNKLQKVLPSRKSEFKIRLNTDLQSSFILKEKKTKRN